ncbi:MAG: PAS domain S-box protein, partial [Deltaproteobacteria bacterium]|nr:PAS domain S-box protein [Deltaproteobacteria bacterium]
MQDKSDSAEEKLKVLNEQLIEREKELEALNRQLAAGNHQLARSEKALGESEKRYRQLVETMSEGLIVMDLNAEITYANPTFCKMLLRDHDGLVGRRFVDFVSDADAESVADLFSRGTGTGAESCEVELVGFEGR